MFLARYEFRNILDLKDLTEVQLYSTFAPAADSTKSGQLSDGVTRAALLRQLG